VPRYCRECEVRFACHGECPKNRFIETPGGEPGLNYPCTVYKAFFLHINKSMRIIAEDCSPHDALRIWAVPVTETLAKNRESRYD
jgi:sulfatase maturation enzyme AslB (radical SAM superfamily)